MHNPCHYLERIKLENLFDALKEAGYDLVGPTLRDGSIVYDSLNRVADLPIGWTDEQEAGCYRVKKRADEACFGFNVGPHSWKKFLFPSRTRLWQANRSGGSVSYEPAENHTPKYAFIGVRSCELHGIFIQDNVFIGETFQDPTYYQRRKDALIVSVNCAQANSTCFCVSMNTGPEVQTGYDLLLDEILKPDEHYFLIRSGSDQGKAILSRLSLREARPEEILPAKDQIEAVKTQMGRQMETSDIKDMLYRNLENPRWDEVAQRCLSCANCTMVCPTCFCSSVEDTADLTGDHAERWRHWDSCFTMDFTYIHGGAVRPTIRSRYRQWLTHKLGTWIDQFGSSGCVGCGRCITWCPVGIDITEEVAALRSHEQQDGEGASIENH